MKPRFAIATALLICLPALASAQELKPDPAAGRELADRREREAAHGLSLRPPIDTRIVRRTADEYAMRLADTRGAFTMSLLIKRTEKPLTLNAVTTSVNAQVLGVEMDVAGVPGRGNKDFQLKGRSLMRATNKGAIVAQRQTVIAKRPASITYYEMLDNKNNPMLLAHAIIQLETQAFAVLDVEGALDRRNPAASAKPIADTFERVIQSIEIENPEELSKRREKTVLAGAQWRQEMRAPAGLKKLHASLVPVQFFRFIEASKSGQPRDYGWMRVRQFASRKSSHDKPGVNVEVQLRVQVGESYFDTLGEYFLSDDDTLEMWSIHTTERPVNKRLRPKDPKAKLPTYRQTGVRAEGVITITQDDPVNGQKKQSFAVPKEGYLSQVEGLLLPQLLPIKSRASYGFYFYNTQTGSVAYREEQLVPALGFTIMTRLTPSSPQLAARYDVKRRLIEKQLDTDGAKLLPADAATIQRIWRTR